MDTQKEKLNSEIATLTNDTLRMNSKEIADMLGKRHDNVKRTIETLSKKGVIQLPQTEEVRFNQSLSPNSKTSAYVFEGIKGKRDSIVVVAQLSPEVTARIVDRWQELENGLSLPNFNDPIEAAYAWIDEKKKNILIESQNRLNKPKVDIHDLFFSPKNPKAKTMSEVAKAINKKRGISLGRNQLYTILVEEKVLNKDYSLHSKFTNSEHFEVIFNGKNFNNTVMVNPSGVKIIDQIMLRRTRLENFIEDED